MGDLSAGVTVGIMLIPQGMAYAMLAGMPPIYGLYAATIPLIIYALLGTSRQLAVGPVAMVSLLVASGVGTLAEIGSSEFISLAILLALMVGMIQFFLGVFRLGFLVNFLSHPVISGFTSAAALIIGFSQLKHLLGLDIPRGKIHETIGSIFQNIDQISITTFMIGVGAIATILILKKINKRIPSPLIVVLLGLAAVYFLGLHEKGVSIIGEVPSGLPLFEMPNIEWSSITSLSLIAFTIAMVSFVESFAVAKAIRNRHKDYEIDANQELIGLGAANIAGSFFGAFPVTGGFSRTAVNDQAGAKSGIAAMISASIVLLTLLFLTPYFYYLPTAVLAAIIIVAVFGLIDFAEAKLLWQKDKLDFIAFTLTAISTLVIGIEPGICIGVLFSLLLVLYRVSFPHVAVLGKVPDSYAFRNINRFADLKSSSDVLIYRFDAQLFFANCEFFKKTIINDVSPEEANSNTTVKEVIIEAAGIHHIDSSSVHMLHDLHQDLVAMGITLKFSEVKGPLRDIFHHNGLFEEIGKENFFLTTESALQSSGEDPKYYTLQTSIA